LRRLPRTGTGVRVAPDSRCPPSHFGGWVRGPLRRASAFEACLSLRSGRPLCEHGDDATRCCDPRFGVGGDPAGDFEAVRVQCLERELGVLERFVEDLLVMADAVPEALDRPETTVGLLLVRRAVRERVLKRRDPERVVVSELAALGG